MLVAGAGCAKRPEKQQAPTVAAATTTVGGLYALPGYLEELIKTPANFHAYLATVETGTPRQNAHPVPVKKLMATCLGKKPTLTFATYATAGVYSHDETEPADGYGYAVAVVNNDSPCAGIGLPFPIKKDADAGSAIIFIAKQESSGAYRLFIVDSSSATIITSYDYKACDPGNKHPWYGDNSLGRPLKNKAFCDHSDPNKPFVAKAGAAAAPSSGMAAPQVMALEEDWTLWISCGADCCYADPGTRGGGSSDSTHKDSTHRDTTHRDTTHRDSAKKPLLNEAH
jgi:hypothetical protein